jgi:hypothetical protein
MYCPLGRWPVGTLIFGPWAFRESTDSKAWLMICISTSGPGSPSLAARLVTVTFSSAGLGIAAQWAIGPADKAEGEGRAAAGVGGRAVKGEELGA